MKSNITSNELPKPDLGHMGPISSATTDRIFDDRLQSTAVRIQRFLDILEAPNVDLGSI